jgi:hypothetical protein
MSSLNPASRTGTASIPLSTLALEAAIELDAETTSTPRTSLDKSQHLAKQLRMLFPGQRPHFSPDSIGLVCGVIENYESETEITEPVSGYDLSTEKAKIIANKLEQPVLSPTEANKLIDFCLSLYRATKSVRLIHDIPADHPYVLTLA